MKIITHESILNAKINGLTCYQWIADAIEKKDKANLPAKVSIKSAGNVFYNTMPVVIPSLRRGGVKIVNRYPGRTPSLDSQILLYDLDTGDLLAFMDGNWITAMRTGAVAAHSVKLFAKPNFSTLGFVGLGNAARASLIVLLELFPDRKFRIKLKKFKNQHSLYMERFNQYKNIEFVICDTYEQTIKGSDVVIQAATYLEDDICEIDCIDEGTVVIPIHTRGFVQSDLYFDRVYADDINHVNDFRNFKSYKNFAEVTDVINQIAKGRENNNERIIVYNIGIALHDIYFANKIYERLKNNCSNTSLGSPTSKFWI